MRLAQPFSQKNQQISVTTCEIMPPKKKRIRQHDHEIGYWTGGKRGVGRFEALTNFGLKLLKHVVAPSQLPSETCFVVWVTQKMGVEQSVETG